MVDSRVARLKSTTDGTSRTAARLRPRSITMLFMRSDQKHRRLALPAPAERPSHVVGSLKRLARDPPGVQADLVDLLDVRRAAPPREQRPRGRAAVLVAEDDRIPPVRFRARLIALCVGVQGQIGLLADGVGAQFEHRRAAVHVVLLRSRCHDGRFDALHRQAVHGLPELRGPKLDRVASFRQWADERVVVREAGPWKQQQFVAAASVDDDGPCRHPRLRHRRARVQRRHRQHAHRSRSGRKGGAEPAALPTARGGQARKRKDDADSSAGGHGAQAAGPAGPWWSRWNHARRSFKRGNSDRWMSEVHARKPSVRPLPVVSRAIALTP